MTKLLRFTLQILAYIVGTSKKVLQAVRYANIYMPFNRTFREIAETNCCLFCVLLLSLIEKRLVK